MSPVDPDVAALLRKFHAEKEVRIRAQLEHNHAQNERRQRNSEISRARVHEQLAASGIDAELLKRQGLRMKEQLEAYKQEVRPALIARASSLAADVHRARGLTNLSIPGLDLIVSDAIGVQTLPATQNQPGEIRMSGSETGDGSGWGLWQTYPTYLVSFWFHLIPTRTAMWTLQALTQYRGFYVVRAPTERRSPARPRDPDCPNCNSPLPTVTLRTAIVICYRCDKCGEIWTLGKPGISSAPH